MLLISFCFDQGHLDCSSHKNPGPFTQHSVFSKFDGDKHVMFHQLDSSSTQYRSTGLVLNVLKLTGLCLQQSS